MKTLGVNSAKGAAIIGSLGQRPRVLGSFKSPALKARFIRTIPVTHPVESRFQRWSSPERNPRAMPQAGMRARRWRSAQAAAMSDGD